MTEVIQAGPYLTWPDPEALVRAWLVAGLGNGYNVRTETDSTFATDSPGASMTLPLVLVQCIPGGGMDLDLITTQADIDVSCFAADRASMWTLYRLVHALMLQLSGRSTDKGTVDRVSVTNGVGEVNYANPNVRRCVTTYSIATRPLVPTP